MKVRGLLIAVAFVAGCSASTSEKEFQKVRDVTQRSDFARDVNEFCIENISRETRRTREALATAMNVSLPMVPSTYCGRLVRGTASGRVTRTDWDALRQGKVTENVLRVIKG